MSLDTTDTSPFETVEDNSPVDRSQTCYFGFEKRNKCFLPDRVSFLEHKTLNEGDRRRYQNETNKEVAFKRTTGDAVLKMRGGDEKHLLLEMAITGWNLLGPDGGEMPFTKGNLERWLSVADPKIVDIVEKEVRKENSWLMADLSVKDIDKQISELNEMREAKLRDEEGKVF